MFIYFSFVKNGEFAGANIVEADDAVSGLEKARQLGINPGGEVMVCEMTADEETRALVNRFTDKLLTEADLHAAFGMEDVAISEVEHLPGVSMIHEQCNTPSYVN